MDFFNSFIAKIVDSTEIKWKIIKMKNRNLINWEKILKAYYI